MDEGVTYNLDDSGVDYFQAKRRAELHAYRDQLEGRSTLAKLEKRGVSAD